MNNLIVYIASILTKDDVKIPNKDGVGSESIEKLLTTVFVVFGGIAVIIIILAGIKFITSQGNPQEVSRARDTIIYAAVGLAISVSAITIVNFVIVRL